MELIFPIIAIFSFQSLSTGFEFLGLQNYIPDRVIEQDTEKVEFLLYPKRKSLRYREELILGDTESIESSGFHKSRPVTLLIHGFVSESKTKSGFTEIVKNAYLTEDVETNVVAVDWSSLSTPKTVVGEALYSIAALNVKPVGRKVADFILFLVKHNFVVGLDDIHVVGFSLGAHVAGNAGSFVFADTGNVVGRITGLDPAGPVFHLNIFSNQFQIIKKEDASFVDILHTGQTQLGYLGALGHVDFYANGGGPSQPNCTWKSVLTGGACSHSTAYRYFAKSIRDPHIMGCKCDKMWKTRSCMNPCTDSLVFGEYCPRTGRGIYYLSITVDAIDT